MVINRAEIEINGVLYDLRVTTLSQTQSVGAHIEVEIHALAFPRASGAVPRAVSIDPGLRELQEWVGIRDDSKPAKCPECGGRKVIELFTSAVPCKRCST
jgi:hypothetical protein